MRRDKILLIQLRTVGDVVMSTALLTNLRRAFPDAGIHYLTETACMPAVAGNPWLDRVIELPRVAWSRMPFLRSLRKSLGFLFYLRRQRYTMVFDLFGNLRSAILTLATGSPARIGYAFRVRKYAYTRRVTPQNDAHEVEFKLDSLRAAGIPVTDKRLFFPVGDEEWRRMDTWLDAHLPRREGLIGLHIWGSWPAKRWEMHKWPELADRLAKATRASILLLWGPGEKKYAEQVARTMKIPGVLIPDTTLKELGALLSRCDLVIANDSGPMHISAAVGTPTVGIYGPTKWAVQGPFGEAHGVACVRDLACLGCNRLTCEDQRCMKELSVNDVMKAALGVLSRRLRTQGGRSRTFSGGIWEAPAFSPAETSGEYGPSTLEEEMRRAGRAPYARMNRCPLPGLGHDMTDFQHA